MAGSVAGASFHRGKSFPLSEQPPDPTAVVFPDRRRLFDVAMYACAYLLLVLALKTFIVPIYGYSGFTWAPSAPKLLEAFGLVVAFGYLLPATVRKPSDLFLHLQFLFPVLPMLVIYGGSGMDRGFTWAVAAAFALSAIIADRMYVHAFRFGRIPPKHVMIGLLGLTGLILLAIVALGGLSYWNVDLFRVYEFRGASFDNLPGVFRYIAPLASKVLIPAALLIAILCRMRAAALLALLASFLLFGLTSHKDVLVYPLAVIALYVLLGRRYPLRLMLAGFAAFVLVGMISLALVGAHDLVGNLGLRRSVLLPGMISYWYHDFFSENALMLWSQSRLSFGLVESPYRLPGAILVGIRHFDSETSNITTGWIGTGFMNGGYVGLFLYGAIIGLFLAYLNSVSRYMDMRAVIAIAAPPTLTLFLSSDLPTAMLNQGALLSLLLFAFFEIRRRAPARRPGRGRTGRGPPRSGRSAGHPGARPDGRTSGRAAGTIRPGRPIRLEADS